mmetsp:Transcript_7422/g.27740  ORF Transcript_7422/g.27740 Transcript_7422/m.27740 type:complete len:510 (+) Transcript_7422:2-1531(+)
MTPKTPPLLHFQTKAPARVNLIGNHIDYNGFSVLPFALEKSTICDVQVYARDNNSETAAAVPRSTTIHLSNQHSDVFSGDFRWTWTMEPDEKQKEEQAEGWKWARYVWSAFNRFATHYDCTQSSKCGTAFDFYITISSDVPVASGLSSSAALLCSSVLVAYVVEMVHRYGLDLPNPDDECSESTTEKLLEANRERLSKILKEHPPNKEELSNWCKLAENDLGMMCGGMDQAVSMLAQQGYAQHISFNPLRHRSVKLPDNLTVVVSNSLIQSKKMESDYFNRRVMECRLGSAWLAKDTGLETWNENVLVPGDVQRQLKKSSEEMCDLVRKYIPDMPLPLKEVADHLGMDVQKVQDLYFGKTKLTEHSLSELKLHRRLLHAYSEAARVQQFIDVCEDEKMSRKDKLAHFATIFEEAHQSCVKNYETSVPELDALIALSSDIPGVVRAKFCGAGFGGIVLSLVDTTQKGASEKVMDALWDKYYSKKFDPSNLDRDTILFATAPSEGAKIIVM